jgi:hypothetical protein
MINNTMIQSRFDAFVNKILRESLQGGNITSTSVGPARPQDIEDGQETTEDDVEQDGAQLPIPNTQQSTKQQTTPQQVANNKTDDAAIKALISQMREDAKKQEEFQKKLIATQTAAMKSNPTQQTTAATNVPNAPATGNANVSQILNNLLNMKA